MAPANARSKELFLAALSRPPAERQEFVETACGDNAELRVDVESLLAGHDQYERADSERSSLDSATELFAPGEMFARRYRMVTRLGHGGMGDVWRADDLVLGIPVALKLVRSTGAEARRLLLNEVRLARQITHPSVCRVFDIGEEQGTSFVPSYLQLLASGGSDTPEALGRLVGVDLADPEFWKAGLAVVDDLVTEAEGLAGQTAGS